MAQRNILTKEQPGLYKKSRPVTEFNPRLHQLLDDMIDTLSTANGVGLAAPQVGVLRRAVIVLETNVPEDEDEYIIELINPEIIEASGEQERARRIRPCQAPDARQGARTEPLRRMVRGGGRRADRTLLLP